MKKITRILGIGLLTFGLSLSTAFAQSPDKMSYQAVVRNASDALVTSTAVGMQISILQGSATGSAVYVETQSPTTNANGLVSLEIGTGTVVSGDFTTIDWANGTYFIKTETDPTTAGGTNYTITGTSQLLSVPYALHANVADSIVGGVSVTETDPTYTASEAANITTTDITNLSNLSGTNTGDQSISRTGTTVTLSNSGGTFTDSVNTYTAGSNITISASNVISATDTDTQLDSMGIANLGFITKDTDTQLDSTDIAGLGFITVDTDTQLDSTGVASLGFVAGAHTVDTDTQLDSTDIATMGFITSAGSGSTDKFYLGQDTLGGIVYYIYKDATGTQHGLIVNKNESTEQWQATGTLTNADRTEDGAYNTTQMTSSAAAIYVTSLGVDWYLPSIDELVLLYYNRFSANKALRAGGNTLLSSTGTYWSSTEYTTTDAFLFRFNNGHAGTYLKNGTLSVRAVRAF